MKYLLLSLIVVAASVPVWSQYDLTKRFGIGGGAGWDFPIWGNKFDDAADSGGMYDFHIRYNATAASGWQLAYTSYDFRDTSLRAKLWDLMYLHRVNPTGRWSPVWGIGAGFSEIVGYKSDENWKFSARARVGVQYAITQNLYASVDLDYQWINGIEGKSGVKDLGAVNALIPQANLTWYFGSGAGAVATAGAGAAAATLTSNMENKGESEVEVHFATDSTEVNPHSHKSLEEVANYLKENPDKKIEIQGHTDSIGPEQVNKEISTARAESVKKYLEDEFHIDPERLSAHGYGESAPLADNTTPEGRAENRRVMIHSL